MARPRKITITQKPDMVFFIPDFTADRYRMWCSWNFGDQFDLIPRNEVEQVLPLLAKMGKVVTICKDGEMPEDYGY